VIAGDVPSRNEGDANPDSQHVRKMSQVIPPGILLSPDVSRQTKDVSIQQANSLSDRRPDIVRADEKRFRALGWKVFREQLEVFADEVKSSVCRLAVQC
jgi:hypothetical protein